MRPVYWIAVVDTETRTWPSAAKLVVFGVPLKVARRYAIVRREFTSGLKRRVRENRN